MNSITTLERPVSALQSAPVLNRNGFACSIVTLAAGGEATLPRNASSDDQLLFVIEGDVAIQSGDLTTRASRGEAMLLPAGDAPVVTARGDDTVRLLRVEIPPRQVVTPQIITPRS
ncbi:MAG TPA: hypothetical protein VG734_03695 [Lacunisphaera sp.]|nr:hypothetical protein [Lacunisphaera sp.]